MKKGNNRTFVITVPGFKEHQKDLKNRHYLALATDFFSNYKVREAKRECLDSIYCFQWLWNNLEYETETLEIRESSLKFAWMDICCAPSNRFDVMKRLNALSNAGLIEFQVNSNDVLTESEPESNIILTESQCDPNQVLTESEHPLEPPVTLAALRATKQKKITNKQTNKGDFSEGFLKFWDEYPSSRRVDQTGCWKKWESRDLESMSETIHASVVAYKQTESWNKNEFQFVPITSTFINQSRWETPVPATGDKPQVGKGKPSWPSQDDPDYDRKVAEYMAGITVGFADAKAERYGN